MQDAGFERLGLKDAFYFFHEAKHDAVLLARYFNGGRRPWRMMDVQQMLWAPVNFIIGVARGSARLVNGAAPVATRSEIRDEEATAAHPPRALPSHQHQQQDHSHQAQEGQHRHADEPSDQQQDKAAITIPVAIEEEVERRPEEALQRAGGSIEGVHQA